MFNHFKIIVLFIIGISMFYTNPIKAQTKKIEFKGQVLDAKTNKPIELAAVCLQELNRWTTTCKKGKFIFKNIKEGKYCLYISCLGYQDYRKIINIQETDTLKRIKLNSVSLAVKEIVVTAKENLGLSSSSKIGKTALNHVQAASLQDVMQLLPGSVSVNPDLSKAGNISIREIDADRTSSLGTAIVLDGAPLTNDANLQINKLGDRNEFSSSAGAGVDLRQIPVENIESVEVIKGVASVEYGDLTSGAVVVKTRAGKSPFHMKIKTDPKMKQIGLGKGYRLGKTKASLNYDIDYTKAYDDLKTKYRGYDRYNLGLAYFNEFNTNHTPISFNFKLTGNYSEDVQENDPEMLASEKFSSKETIIRSNMYGRWCLNKSWITNIKYSFSASSNIQESIEKKIVNTNGVRNLADSRVSGEYESVYLPNNYLSNLKIKGNPVNYYGQIIANLAGKYGAVVNKFLIGAEYRYSANKGEGKIFDPKRPPNTKSANGNRPRSYHSIPALKKYAFMIEDKIKFDLFGKCMDIQAGVRLNNFQPNGFTQSDIGFYFEPRFNMKYHLINDCKNRKYFQCVKIRGGYGVNRKAPPLLYMYPDKVYLDKVSCNYYSIVNPDNRLLVMSTKVVDIDGSHVKPSLNKKFEVGADIKFAGINLSFTAYKEKGENEFGFVKQYIPFGYRKYDEIGQDGLKPIYRDGRVWVNNQPVSYKDEISFVGYNQPANMKESTREGIEFTVNFGKIKSLNTSFVLDGAWMKSERITDLTDWEQVTELHGGNEYPYIGIYPSGLRTERERFTTNLRLITHIPVLKILVSATIQAIWKNNYRYKWEGNNSENLVYLLDKNGNRVYGNSIYDNSTETKYIDPIYYMDKSGEIHKYTSDLANQDEYKHLVRDFSNTFFLKEDFPTVFQFNLKLSKEISDVVNLSFYANNFINHRPKFLSNRSGAYVIQNPEFYFGAELLYKF